VPEQRSQPTGHAPPIGQRGAANSARAGNHDSTRPGQPAQAHASAGANRGDSDGAGGKRD
jgi:hypothetical protein